MMDTNLNSNKKHVHGDLIILFFFFPPPRPDWSKYGEFKSFLNLVY